MTKPANTTETLSLHVPFRIAKRGGRKEVQLPADAPTHRSRVDNTMVKALARTFRWQKMLENGTHATLLDLAKAEKINPSYVSRVLRLTLLTPQIVEAILDGTQGPEVTLARAIETFPIEWKPQVILQTRNLKVVSLTLALVARKSEHQHVPTLGGTMLSSISETGMFSPIPSLATRFSQ